MQRVTPPEGRISLAREYMADSISSQDARSPAVERAAQYDAVGQHEAALDELARATKSGDVQAMACLAKRLIVGDRAPHLPGQGAGFLIDATRAGSAEAPARLAVLAATGAFVQQSWADALKMLVLAAQRGWGSARRQLRVLCQDRALAESAPPRASEAQFWMRLAAEIDLGAWLRPIAGRTMRADPLMRIFPALLPAEVCDWLIAEARPRLARARVYDSTQDHAQIHDTRSNSAASFTLMDAELLHLTVQARIGAACEMPIRNMEAPSVLHYAPGERFSPHYDFIDPESADAAAQIARQGQRVITFLVYLNDAYDGGETHFPQLGVRHRGRRGEGMYFVNALAGGEPDPRTLHAGLAPTRGEKWVLSQFVRGRAFLEQTLQT